MSKTFELGLGAVSAFVVCVTVGAQNQEPRPNTPTSRLGRPTLARRNGLLLLLAACSGTAPLVVRRPAARRMRCSSSRAFSLRVRLPPQVARRAGGLAARLTQARRPEEEGRRVPRAAGE